MPAVHCILGRLMVMTSPTAIWAVYVKVVVRGTATPTNTFTVGVRPNPILGLEEN